MSAYANRLDSLMGQARSKNKFSPTEPSSEHCNVSKPIKVWSSKKGISPDDLCFTSSQVFVENGEYDQAKNTKVSERDAEDSSVADKPELVVYGISKSTLQNELSKHDIDQQYWSRFVDAINAALSQLPAWQTPKTIERRRMSSVASPHEIIYSEKRYPRERRASAYCIPPEPLQRNKAEKLLNWWNKDYFDGKGCYIEIEYIWNDSNTCVPNLKINSKD